MSKTSFNIMLNYEGQGYILKQKSYIYSLMSNVDIEVRKCEAGSRV